MMNANPSPAKVEAGPRQGRHWFKEFGITLQPEDHLVPSQPDCGSGRAEFCRAHNRHRQPAGGRNHDHPSPQD
jgi:hypothetical protein